MYPANPFTQIHLFPSLTDTQPLLGKRILLVVNLPKGIVRLADTLLVEEGDIELEGLFELWGEWPFLGDLGSAGIQYEENPLLNLSVAFWFSCSQGWLAFCK